MNHMEFFIRAAVVGYCSGFLVQVIPWIISERVIAARTASSKSRAVGTITIEADMRPAIEAFRKLKEAAVEAKESIRAD
jgi:hypothetical protein